MRIKHFTARLLYRASCRVYSSTETDTGILTTAVYKSVNCQAKITTKQSISSFTKKTKLTRMESGNGNKKRKVSSTGGSLHGTFSCACRTARDRILTNHSHSRVP